MKRYNDEPRAIQITPKFVMEITKTLFVGGWIDFDLANRVANLYDAGKTWPDPEWAEAFRDLQITYRKVFPNLPLTEDCPKGPFYETNQALIAEWRRP